jgi:hypothetical protein
MVHTTEYKTNKGLVSIWIWDLLGSIETLKLGFLYRKEKV